MKKNKFDYGFLWDTTCYTLVMYSIKKVKRWFFTKEGGIEVDFNLQR